VTRILHMITSPRADSESAALTTAFVDAYVQGHPETEVDVLDLWKDPVAPFDGDRVGAKMTVLGGQSLAGAQATAWDSIAETFARFAAADLYVIGVPMWNAGIPWILKQYIDTITQPGMIWSLDMEAGYTGLLQGKTAVTVYTSGVYADGVPPSFGRDFQTTYFRDWLNFAGITDVHEIRFQPTILPTNGPVDERREIALTETRQLAQKL